MNETLFTYGCRNRPPYEAAPQGRRIDLDAPDDKRANYGTIAYTRQLTPREVYSYELIPIDPPLAHPAYPEGATVKDMRNGKTYTVELFREEWFIGDYVLDAPLDWIFYELVTEH